MRLSVKKSSPFYDEAKIALHPQAFVDGVPLTHCFEASEEEGWADRYVADDNGKLIPSEDQRSMKTERLHGQVEIRFVALHQ